MTTPMRLAAPVSVLLVALLVAGCGSATTPSTSAAAAATPSAPLDPAALANYTDAMCPIFAVILAIDPRLGDLREAAAAGGDMSGEATDMAALSDELLILVTDLEAVPDWEPGRAVRHHLRTSLHGIRALLLHVGRDPSAHDAAEDITAMPFIATEALDRAMNAAASGGLRCEVAD